MAKDPAFLFYTGDFSTGTQFFTNEQVGKYLRLLMAQHQLGHLSEKHMLIICGTRDEDIFSKFAQDEKGLYFNERLDKEILRRRAYSESRSNNRKTSEISKSYDSTHVEHMETKNEIENKVVIENKKVPKKNKEPEVKPHLFKDSPYFDIEAFKNSIGDKYQFANLEYYHESVKNWSDSIKHQPKKWKSDWLATARNFILGDKRDGKLQLAKGSKIITPQQEIRLNADEEVLKRMERIKNGQ